MAITQLTTANTFQQWLIATQALITTANTLTDGNGASFIANTKLDVSGSQSQLNVRTNAGINQLYANNISVSGNVATINTTSSLYVGANAYIYGDLTVSGNIILDAIGFDDINANGSANIAENLVVGLNTILNTATITGNSSISNTYITYGNMQTANVAEMVGDANTAVYANVASAYTRASDDAVAFSIALG